MVGQQKAAHWVDQKANNPKFKGSNPAAVGLIRKQWKYFSSYTWAVKVGSTLGGSKD